jgi:hypothetical protein
LKKLKAEKKCASPEMVRALLEEFVEVELQKQLEAEKECQTVDSKQV